MLHIFNNLTKQKERFKPIDPSNVRMYVCGMTVYDYCHVGHGRALVVFDMVYRYLCQVYGAAHVTYVRNITDIDDKIINRACENQESTETLVARFIEEMNKDANDLSVIYPNQEPRATQHMGDIIAMVKQLVDRGYAYAAENGDVYYAVSCFESYGALSGKKTEELRAGTRVEVDEAKRDPVDFVLWKAAKPDEPSWDSPWGRGRPGWHIECSAMSTCCLGNHFDIHGGGLDLQFPHHENEIAQSEAATGEKFVNVWMHNGHVRIDNEKMSKSLGNFFTLREVMQTYKPEILRFFFLSSHYRSPLNYSDVHLDNARAGLDTLYNAIRGLDITQAGFEAEEETAQRFLSAMDDDFNTPEAISQLFDLAKECNRLRNGDEKLGHVARQLKGLAGLLGLLQRNPEDYFKQAIPVHAAKLTSNAPTTKIVMSEETVDALIERRNRARQDKDWAESDRIRDELATAGIMLEDGAKGTTWRRQ